MAHGSRAVQQCHPSDSNIYRYVANFVVGGTDVTGLDGEIEFPVDRPTPQSGTVIINPDGTYGVRPPTCFPVIPWPQGPIFLPRESRQPIPPPSGSHDRPGPSLPAEPTRFPIYIPWPLPWPKNGEGDGVGKMFDLIFTGFGCTADGARFYLMSEGGAVLSEGSELIFHDIWVGNGPDDKNEINEAHEQAIDYWRHEWEHLWEILFDW